MQYPGCLFVSAPEAKRNRPNSRIDLGGNVEMYFDARETIVIS